MIITPLLVIFNIFLFVVLYFFLKTIDKRKWLNIIIALCLTPIVYFYVFYPLLNIFSSYHHQKYFNSELWVKEPSLRFEMTDNIIKSNTLIGKTKLDIQALLGNYEWLRWNDSLKNHDDNYWNYSLGQEPGAFNTMKECMTIIFKDDKVAAIETFNEKIILDAEN
jgi:hypothetical protein